MKLTLRNLNKIEACDEAIEWFQRYKGKNVWEDAAKEHPGWVLWGVAQGLDGCPPDVLDRCAKLWPWWALVFAARHLTPEGLDRCAKKEPGRALEYAAKYLTAERLKWCRERVYGRIRKVSTRP